MQSALALMLTVSALAQTKVYLDGQSQGYQFLRPPFHAPLRSGASLPDTCVVNELFFLTSAAPGNNIHVCYSTNQWTPSGSSGPATLTVYASGSLVAARTAVNFIPGTGTVDIIADTGARVDIQRSVNTAIVATKSYLQTNEFARCNSTEASPGVHQCSLMPALTALTTGMVLHWTPSVEVSGVATLNVDALGAKAVKLWDGSTNAQAGDIPAGTLTPIWYDGTVWRLLGPGVGRAATGARPTCAAAVRGRVWLIAGGAGVADTVTVCAKDAADSYAWRTIY